jgi:hypothetical protein
MILIGQPEHRPGGPPTSSPRPVGSGKCQPLTAVVAGLMAGGRIARACDGHCRAILARCPRHRDDAISPSRVPHAGEPALRGKGPNRDAGPTLGGTPARLDVHRTVRIRYGRPMQVPAMCHWMAR